MGFRRGHTYKMFRETKTKAINITTSLIMVASSLGGALPVLLSQKAAALGGTVVVHNLSNQGWTTDDTRTGGAVTLVSDATAPAGSGALRLTTDASTTSKAQFTTYFSPVPLASVSNSSLSYATKQNSAAFAGGDPAYQLYVYVNGTSGFDTLTYEPYVNEGNAAIHQGDWQNWDVGSGVFYSSHDFTGTGGSIQTSQGTYTYTLDQIRADFPNIAVIGMGVNIGSNNPSYDVEADNFAFNGTTYDFDPVVIPACSSSDTTFDTFSDGSVNGQHGWQSTGSYDQAVVDNTYGFNSFGCKSLRISNAVTSGSFGDQTFSYSTPNEAGEADSTSGGQSGGIRQDHYEAQFDIASTSANQQPGLSLSVSPDRGDGSRMSYLRFEDRADGIHVFFDDVQGTDNPANFVESDIATLSRTAPHTIKFAMDFNDGPSNDVVQVYIDGSLVHTGTSWENYYRYDSEASAEQSPRTVDSLLFRAGGTPAPATAGNGFLFDNVNISTSQNDTTPPPVPGLTSPSDGASIKPSDATLNWTDVTDPDGSNPVTYEYQSSYSSSVNGTNNTLSSVIYHASTGTASQINATGSADATYYWQVRACDSLGNCSNWSGPWKVTIDSTAPAVPANLKLKATPSNTNIPDGGYTNSYNVLATWDSVSGTDHYMYKYWNNIPTSAYDGEANALAWSVSSNQNAGVFNQGEGTHYFAVSACDAAGNCSAYSTPFSVTYDATAPVVHITAPSAGSVLHGTVTVSGTVNDTNPDHYYFVVKDSHGTVKAGPGTVNQATVSDWSWNTKNVPDGTYTIDLEARDKAGNKDAGSTATIQVSVDNTAPVASIDAYSGTDTTPTLTGKVNDPTASLTVAIDGGTTQPATNKGDGTWSFDIATALSVGSHTVVLTATDTVGNGYQTTANVSVQAPHASPTGLAASQNNGNSNQATGHQPTVTVTPNNDGQVLGDTATNTTTGNTGKVKGDNTVNLKNAGSKKSGNFLLFGWWWLAIIAVLGAFWLILAKRRSSDEG